MHVTDVIFIVYTECIMYTGCILYTECIMCSEYSTLFTERIIYNPVTKLRIGTALAGDTHSLACRTNPPAASTVPWYDVALGYRKGDKSTSGQPKIGRYLPLCLVLHNL